LGVRLRAVRVMCPAATVLGEGYAVAVSACENCPNTFHSSSLLLGAAVTRPAVTAYVLFGGWLPSVLWGRFRELCITTLALGPSAVIVPLTFCHIVVVFVTLFVPPLRLHGCQLLRFACSEVAVCPSEY
jgi:hypothetical protein